MTGTLRGVPARYEDVALVARGGMADVYRATDTALGRTVAVKVLSDRYASDSVTRARFRREALTAASLSHPNVVTIYDVGEQAESPYLVMEYLQGGSLADRISDGRGLIPHAQVLTWLGQAASALDAAHAAGIVHRDVKPANLLVDDDGEVHVGDFGIARAAADDSLTSTGTILGTSGYMAPEQARGTVATPASDRYALACVAYELLTGSRPFRGESAAAEMAMHASEPPPRASRAAASLPPAVDDVLVRALAKEPDERPATAAALVHELTGALQGIGWPGDTGATLPMVHVRQRRFRPVAAAAFLALAAGGAAVGLLVTRGGGSGAATVVLTETEVQHVTSTLQGETVVQTVTLRTPATVSAPKPEAAPAGSPNDGSLASAAAENDRAYRLMQQGDFRGALPLLENASRVLTGSHTLPEAYASYNLAFTRLALGSCEDVAALLDHSEEIQGRRKEITRLRRSADRACGD